jgi:hypothetical protein
LADGVVDVAVGGLPEFVLVGGCVTFELVDGSVEVLLFVVLDIGDGSVEGTFV